MKINYLIEFAMLADKANYFDAADELYISQSTLSRHMQSLEKELDKQLFLHASRRVVLSEEGQLLLPYARKISEYYNAYLDRSKESSRKGSKRLIIGSISFMTHYNLLTPIAKYKKRYPDVDVEIMECETSHLHNKMRDHNCDVAFVFGTDDSMITEDHIVVGQEDLIAIVPDSFEASVDGRLHLDGIGSRTVYVDTSDAVLMDYIVRQITSKGVSSEQIINVDKKNLRKLVQENEGIAVIPTSVGRAMQKAGTKTIKLSDEIPVRIVLLCHSDATQEEKNFANLFLDGAPMGA